MFISLFDDSMPRSSSSPTTQRALWKDIKPHYISFFVQWNKIFSTATGSSMLDIGRQLTYLMFM